MSAVITNLYPRAAPQGGKRGQGGKRADLDNRYYRSCWEANVARYLNWLQAHGEIRGWDYEAQEYAFPVKRGVRFYKRDFCVYENTGAEVLWEVKGWMDAKSRTALNRMAKYYPAVKIIVIDEVQYKAIARTMRHIIPTWETGAAPSRPIVTLPAPRPFGGDIA
jgi:hypothetical protein